MISVHRIGRTGRSEKTGIATTFVNKANDESVLLDLKHLLIEAKQKVPLFLANLQSENEKYLDLGGTYTNLFFLVNQSIWLFNFFFYYYQMNVVVVTVVVSVTESRIVRNWKLFNLKQQAISEEEIIWQITLRIINFV